MAHMSRNPQQLTGRLPCVGSSALFEFGHDLLGCFLLSFHIMLLHSVDLRVYKACIAPCCLCLVFLIVLYYTVCLQVVKSEKDPKLKVEDLQDLTVKIVVERHHADQDVKVVHTKKD